MEKLLSHLDLFSGIGVFTLAFQKAGFRCVGQVEIDKNCQRLLSKKWARVPKFGDVTAFKGDEVECPGVVTFGSPCQDLSVAGERAGLKNGERSNLFYEATRIIRALVPRGLEFALWENVEGAFSSRGGCLAIAWSCHWRNGWRGR